VRRVPLLSSLSSYEETDMTPPPFKLSRITLLIAALGAAPLIGAHATSGTDADKQSGSQAQNMAPAKDEHSTSARAPAASAPMTQSTIGTTYIGIVPLPAVTGAQQDASASGSTWQRQSAAPTFVVGRASGLIGKKVTSGERELGTIQDLALDMTSGEVQYAIVGGSDDGRVRAVKVSELEFSDDGSFEMKAAARKHASADAFIGKQVVGSQGETLGTVSDLLVNLDSNRVSFAVIDPQGESEPLLTVRLSDLRIERGDNGSTSRVVASGTADEVRWASSVDRNSWYQLKEPGEYALHQRTLISLEPIGEASAQKASRSGMSGEQKSAMAGAASQPRDSARGGPGEAAGAAAGAPPAPTGSGESQQEQSAMTGAASEPRDSARGGPGEAAGAAAGAPPAPTGSGESQQEQSAKL
jgi:sporulation protein YlmC with PRC-barrel domain